MGLTMTRTRTQTALTRLAKLLANLNAELEFVERLKGELPLFDDALEVRRAKLAEDRVAVCATIRQFDPELSLAEIGTSDRWKQEYRSRSPDATVQRYLKAIGVLS
jgi:hypothetical protein